LCVCDGFELLSDIVIEFVKLVVASYELDEAMIGIDTVV